ncbi:hypothetical protein ESCO_005114 [Escovopsis weberi]|uniref:DUF7707 domain-containing protein n=1 Tax=Escovopsis weberi TaxID=150374 RepID=A0A0M8N7N2_ESCWE|nr:hypothetical protein ESCO_005114 [Escovopsis weberi]
MLFRSALLATAALFGSVAQADYVIDPKTVPLSTRQAWCASELATCPLICEQFSNGNPKTNACDSNKLTYGCVCGNGQQPNISEYTLTLSYFVCQEYGNQCVTKCGNDNECAGACREDHPCGATSPKRYNVTATASAPSSTSTSDDDAIFTGTPGGGPSKKGAAASLDIGRTYGLAVVLGSMFVGFAML